MTNEMKENELKKVAGGQAVNGMYYTVLPAGWTAYRIHKNDTLSGLAVAYKTTVTNIMAHNPLIDNANFILEGFWICLPVT